MTVTPWHSVMPIMTATMFFQLLLLTATMLHSIMTVTMITIVHIVGFNVRICLYSTPSLTFPITRPTRDSDDMHPSDYPAPII